MVISEPNDRDHAYSWREAKRLAREQGHGEKIVVSKTSEPMLPPEFERSNWSVKAGAEAVYRDQKETDSFQIREYKNKWTVELDHHNPETGNAIAHAVRDAPKYTAVAVVVAGAAVSGLGS